MEQIYIGIGIFITGFVMGYYKGLTYTPPKKVSHWIEEQELLQKDVQRIKGVIDTSNKDFKRSLK